MSDCKIVLLCFEFKSKREKSLCLHVFLRPHSKTCDISTSSSFSTSTAASSFLVRQ